MTTVLLPFLSGVAVVGYTLHQGSEQ